MSEIKSFVSKFKDWFSSIKNKKNVLIVSIGFIGIFLIFISVIVPDKSKEIIKKPYQLLVFRKKPTMGYRKLLGRNI